MRMRNIFAVQKLSLSRKILVGALLLGAAIGFVYNFNRIQTATQHFARTTFASEEVFENVSTSRKWVLIGKEFTAEQKTLTVSANLSESFLATYQNPEITYKVADTHLTGTLKASASAARDFTGTINTSSLKPGKYQVMVAVSAGATAVESEPVEFYVSYPLYVTWTLDWEGYDVKQEYLDAIDEIAGKHGIPVTHFFNPRIYTSPAISNSRANYLTSWVIERKNTRGDSIGLHMHMFPDMVAAAGVAPRTDPAWGSPLKDGYDILTSGYSYEETVKMLNWAKQIFAQKGLGTPISFRAGGWFADEETLKALQDTGFKLDSSGRTKYVFGTNNIAGHWDLSAVTAPYQPNISDQNSNAGPTLNLWEFPNNGADSWEYSQQDLYQRFSANFSGAPLGEKQVITYLSHPEWFNRDNPKIQGLFTQIDGYLYSQDSGPVIYVTLDQAYQVWAR